MYDLPEHLIMGLTEDGQGPMAPDEPGFHHWGCWCGDPDCTRWRDD